jgi:hypothetical protein
MRMSSFRKIDFGTPIRERVLLYWERTGHIEDGELYFTEEGQLRHILFDGETLNDEPTHWMNVPKVEVSE